MQGDILCLTYPGQEIPADLNVGSTLATRVSHLKYPASNQGKNYARDQLWMDE